MSYLLFPLYLHILIVYRKHSKSNINLQVNRVKDRFKLIMPLLISHLYSFSIIPDTLYFLEFYSFLIMDRKVMNTL